MKASQRYTVILAAVSAADRVSIGDLSRELNVSEMTVRRDLDMLEREGALLRVHGGATRAGSGSYEPPFALRARTNTEAKTAIASAVAAAIRDGETVLLDGGSTGVAVAEALVGRELTVCTLNLRAATILAVAPGIRLIVPGGVVRPGELSFVGPPVMRTLEDHRFDSFVLTVSGISAQAGLTEWNLDDTAVKRAGLQAAARCLVACDATKFGRVAFGRICPIDQVDLIVTDKSLSRDERTAMASAHGILRIA